MNFYILNRKVYTVSFIALFCLLILTCYHRTEHFDDAWFAEQSYWLVKDGKVRSELFSGLNGWEKRIYVFHKLFIYIGALFMSVLGFSLAASKLLTTLCACITGYLIWKYTKECSREEQWLAVILYFGCGTIIRYFAVNRPEIMCMTLGFASYIYISKNNKKLYKILLGGLFAGLSALTHLNGMIYLAAGALWLLTQKNWRYFAWFVVTGLFTLSFYLFDALIDNKINVMISQFTNDPATQANFKVIDKLKVMLNFHQIFFHSHGEVPLTVLALICLLFFRQQYRLRSPALLYLFLLIISFFFLTKSNFDFYYVLFVPWISIFVSTCLVSYSKHNNTNRLPQGLIISYICFSLFSNYQVLDENYSTPYVPLYNSTLATNMPDQNVKIIAPISFFFGQIEKYKIHGLSYYYMLNDKKPISLKDFFRLAEQEKAKYVVSDGYKTASYVIPLDAPVRIGQYKRIYQDGFSSIYEHD